MALALSLLFHLTLVAQYIEPDGQDAYLAVKGFCFRGNFFWGGDYFKRVGNADWHPVSFDWRYRWWIGQGKFTRSYIHFDRREFPSCVAKAYLSLYFSGPAEKTDLYYVDWNGRSFGWFDRPAEKYIDSFDTPGRWVKIDVTDAVQEAIASGKEIAFMVRLAADLCPGESMQAKTSFTKAYLYIEPCIEVKVSGLKDATITQPDIGAHRYISLGKLTVKVASKVDYEVRACYSVDPDPLPPFGGDPLDIAYTWVWSTLPACAPDDSSYIVLPGFSGAPGSETHIYRVRVDLADLGDRAAGEGFEFAIRVWAVPQ